MKGKIMANYDLIVESVQKCLENKKNKSEWEKRYEDYINKLNKASEQLRNARDKFYVPKPFQLYMPLSMAKKCNGTYTYFDLRFHGQSVGQIRAANKETDRKVELKIYEKKTLLNAMKKIKATDSKRGTAADQFENLYKSWLEWEEWNSDKAKEFRTIYSELENGIKNNKSLLKMLEQPEHDMESYLLKNFAQKSSSNKEVALIQPVTMSGTSANFQMPTPIKASKAKNGPGNISYSKSYGGGIDILARVGSGKGTKLAILELKDENNKHEPPEKAINQAIAYATFIRELLRSDCGKDWWEFFGFGGEIPERLVLKAIIVMPNENNPSTDFCRETLKIRNNRVANEDTIELGYIYRAKGNEPQMMHI